MRRRTRSREGRQLDNHERWLVSYADFITLLFAFFVVMYALSSVNESKYRALKGSLVDAFGTGTGTGGASTSAAPGSLPPVGDLPPRREPRSADTTASRQQREQREQMRGIAQDIMKALDALVSDGQVRVTQSNRGVSVEISASLLFAPGQAQLQPDSVRALQQLARILAPLQAPIQVEGYTDDQPIGTTQFPSNWELSAARAASVVRLIASQGVAEPRLNVVGYGSNRALVANTSPEGRARNRRVTLMILAEAPDKVVEIPLAPASAVR
jgi:chemotaxis protein MotB